MRWAGLPASAPLSLVDGASKQSAERFDGYPAFGHDLTVAQDHRDAEVVKTQQLGVGIDVASRRRDSQGPERCSRVITEMAALASHELDGHRGR